MLHVRARVFRAIDDVEACRRYAIHHHEVLTGFDLANVTSLTRDWTSDANIVVVLLEDESDASPLGGIRLERLTPDQPLPIERALSRLDRRVHELVQSADGPVAELCGLWSSPRLRGTGMGKLLTRMGVYVAATRGIETLFGICDERSLPANFEIGFVVEHRLAQRGAFRYPRPDLTAYALRGDLAEYREPGRTRYQTIRQFWEAPTSSLTTRGRAGDIRVAWDCSPPADA
jgi:hypothetical protein